MKCSDAVKGLILYVIIGPTEVMDNYLGASRPNRAGNRIRGLVVGIMAKPNPSKTINQVLDEFLAEQKARWSHATYAKHEMIVGLLKAYMERYWPRHDDAYNQVTKAGGTYCGTYGPEDIAGAFGMFLSYFMPHKVIGSEATFQAAPRVVRKLAKWLAAKGYDPDAADAVD